METNGKERDLDITEDELKRIQEALKKDEFRKLFTEYAEEISDPENRKLYEAEIAQMENDRGMDIKFINPTPGYVIKTSVNGDTKAFINVCTNELIGKPSSKKGTSADGRSGLSWSLPHSFAPPRDDTDKTGQKCRVFDFVIHPDTYRMAETNTRFKKMVHDSALDGIERQFDIKLDKKNIKFPKMKFKGTPTATVIRTKVKDAAVKERDPDDVLNGFPYPYDNIPSDVRSQRNEDEIQKREERKKTGAAKTTESTAATDDTHTEPTFQMKHRSKIDIQDFRNAPDAKPSIRPQELVIDIALPLLTSAKQVDLDVFEQRLKLTSTKPAKYKLDIALPYPVDEETGSAKFDKNKHCLTVTLPVIPKSDPKITFANGGVLDDLTNGDGTCEKDTLPTANGTTQCSENRLIEEIRSEDLQVVTDDVDTECCGEDACMSASCDRDVRLPEFSFQQDEGCITFILHVKNVAPENIVMSVAPPGGCQLQLTSLGPGGFPMHYAFCVRFPDGCSIDSDECRVDTSCENVVVLLPKMTQTGSPWSGFQAGVDETQLQVSTTLGC